MRNLCIKIQIFFLTFTLLLIFNVDGRAQESPGLLFQAGLYAEEIQGDLDKALSYFKIIIKDYSNNRPLAANALLHIGLCYEKLGKENARAIYQRIVAEYPDQREIATTARELLNKINSRPKPIDPLVKYYFERLGVDITTGTSWDGNYFAYSDWTNGNLFIKNLQTGEKRRLTDVDWTQSNEYAYRPKWSRDGKYIAYSYNRKPYFIELRVVSVDDGKSRIIYSDPELIIFPQDWHPDGNSILCETYNFNSEPNNRLALISIDSSILQDFGRLSENSLGMKFSSDGKYITYDLGRGGGRSVFVMALKNSQVTPVCDGMPGRLGGYDAPVWSENGKLILCRSSGQYDLWAIPINKGLPSAKPFIVQPDLSKALLSIKGIIHHVPPKMKQRNNKQVLNRRTKKYSSSFIENFSSQVLDSAWSVFEWKEANVYGYASFGRYSLTESPGYLRYYVDAIMDGSRGQVKNYQPCFTGWYWYYPALEISRPLSGDHWILEVKGNFYLSPGADTRSFTMVIVFDVDLNQENFLVISRSNEFRYNQNTIDVKLHNPITIIARKSYKFSSTDTPDGYIYTHYYRISRSDTLIQFELSNDGTNYIQVFSANLNPELRDLTQSLILTGNSWFVPAGSHVDWDYVRFTIFD